MKYHLITYGCQMNTADSQEMAQPLASRGFLATARLSDADIVLMNTCTVREQAEHRADSNLGRLRKWKDADPHRILIVAGCAATRWGNSIQEKYPFIDLVSPATQIEQFPEAVSKVLKERWDWDTETNANFSAQRTAQSEELTASALSAARSALSAATIFGSDATAYVTIMRGCNYSCSYCIVPQVRGREVYRPMPQILDEISQKAAGGQKEVMLLGQTVNSYYWRNGKNNDFSDLLRAVQEIPEVETIRFMSPHPRHMRDRVIDAMKDCPKVARHLHLPVQSGSDKMLAQMKRLYTRQDYLTILEKLRAAIPGILITTDVIVGFPGESAEDFEQTLILQKEAQFNGLFAFKYSPRPGTASADFSDDVPNPLKEERLQKVLALNTELAAAW